MNYVRRRNFFTRAAFFNFERGNVICWSVAIFRPTSCQCVRGPMATTGGQFPANAYRRPVFSHNLIRESQKPNCFCTVSFVLLRDALVRSNVAAIAHAVLFRRLRTLLIRPHGNGLIASTMNFDYEVRSAEEAFEEAPKVHIEGEMLDLAKHIIATKKGSFDPKEFDDRYDAALMELVQAKAEGKTIKPVKEPKVDRASSLLEALRESAGVAGKTRARTAAKSRAAGSAKAGKKSASGERRKAG